MYTYHIVYIAGDVPSFQIGDLTVDISYEIHSSSDLEKLRNLLKKDKNEENIIILNYKKIT